jgi:acyl-CoA reductase-like NAD-dependent aldehyde dehydrogenase
VQRIFVHRDIYEDFTTQFVERVNELVVGDPLDEETDVGPLITVGDAERIEAWVGEAVRDGARLLTGGSREGSLMRPAVLTEVNRAMKLSCVEAFGPVCSLQPFDDFYEALREINDSVYGLQAGIFTRDMGKVMRAFDELEVGGLMVNDVPTYRVDNMPYGGVKESGMGREGPRYTMEEMTELRLMAINMAAFEEK